MGIIFGNSGGGIPEPKLFGINFGHLFVFKAVVVQLRPGPEIIEAADTALGGLPTRELPYLMKSYSSLIMAEVIETIIRHCSWGLPKVSGNPVICAVNAVHPRSGEILQNLAAGLFVQRLRVLLHP